MSIFDKVHNSPKKKPAIKSKKPKPEETQEPEKPKTRSKKKDEPEKEIDKLVIEAQRAELMDTIHKAELSAYKVEKEKMILMKAAGDVAELPFMEFLYFGYMEKCNSDMLSMMKRLDPIITNLVKEGNSRGITKRVNKEIKAILTEIKKSQAEDVRDWRKKL